ncbi:MAG: ubiquinone/menaquinone biosynthesis methyltransferase [Myxococcales bacterium]|nr:ubiquinone/menaquinone biosynthesis methyltransferase [Myxococcales bacterium]
MSSADGSGGMFDRIAPRYDMLNRVLSLGLDRGWRRALVRALARAAEGPLLDVATGTADVALALARAYPDARIVGVDTSREMLAVGAAKVARAGLTERIQLRVADAAALSFERGDFAASAIAFGIRNVPDRARGLAEMARVTRAGGPVVVLELGEPDAGVFGPIARVHLRHVVPRLGAWLSGAAEYRYLQTSVAAFPTPARFAELMSSAGIELERVERLGFGAAHLYVGHARG